MRRKTARVRRVKLVELSVIAVAAVDLDFAFLLLSFPLDRRPSRSVTPDLL